MNWNVQILSTSEPDFSQWKDCYNRLENKGIYHSPEYISCLEKHYQDDAELFLFGNEKEYIYYPYFKRRLDKLLFSNHCGVNFSKYFDIVSSWYYGGPLSNNTRDHEFFFKEFIKVFSDYCQHQGFVSEFIRFDPNLQNHLSFLELLPVTQNRKSVYVDLSQSKDQIWTNMQGRARTAVRKAKRLGVTVRRSNNIEDIIKFCEIYDEEMEKKGAPSHYLFGQEFILQLFNTLGNKIELIYALVDDIFISGGLFIYEVGEAVHYYLMATDYNYIQYQANNLILHEAMLYFKEKGIKIFDFQGGREGVYNFKKSFSKNYVSFFTCGMIHNPPLYKKLVQYKNESSGKTVHSFFPEYRIKDTN